MDDRLERAVKAALAEMNRQNHEGGEGSVYVYEDADPRSVGVDGRMDLVAVIEAALKAAEETVILGGPINKTPKRLSP